MVAFILRLKVTYERLFEMGWGCFFLSFFFSFRLKAVSFFKIRMTYQRVFEFSFIYIYVVVFLILFQVKGHISTAVSTPHRGQSVRGRYRVRFFDLAVGRL